MQLGMIGLGRMGANMVRRLMRDGHDCVVYDRSQEPVEQLQSEGATGSDSLEDFLSPAVETANGVDDGTGRRRRRNDRGPATTAGSRRRR